MEPDPRWFLKGKKRLNEEALNFARIEYGFNENRMQNQQNKPVVEQMDNRILKDIEALKPTTPRRMCAPAPNPNFDFKKIVNLRDRNFPLPIHVQLAIEKEE